LSVTVAVMLVTSMPDVNGLSATTGGCCAASAAAAADVLIRTRSRAKRD